MLRSRLTGWRKRDVERIFFAGLIIEMECRECAPGFGKDMKIGSERNPREILCKIVREALAVAGLMENAVDVFEYRVLGDGIIVVMRRGMSPSALSEMFSMRSSLRSVYPEIALCARPLHIAVARESTGRMRHQWKVRHRIDYECGERFGRSHARDADRALFPRFWQTEKFLAIQPLDGETRTFSLYTDAA